jgi:hypothetical protein
MMPMKQVKTFTLLVRAFALSAVCLALFPSCATSPQRIDVFILDPQTTQYFVSPIFFEAPKLSASVDFTVRVSEGTVKSVVCNYSLVGEAKTPDPPSELGFIVPGDEGVYYVRNMKLMFADVAKRTVRYTSELDPQDFYAVFADKAPDLQVVSGGKSLVFKPTKEGLKQFDAAHAQFTYGR